MMMEILPANNALLIANNVKILHVLNVQKDIFQIKIYVKNVIHNVKHAIEQKLANPAYQTEIYIIIVHAWKVIMKINR